MNIGDKVLVTTDDWFLAPDGENYKSVYGTVKGVFYDQDTQIGNMMIADFQINSTEIIESCSDKSLDCGIKALNDQSSKTKIYNADKDYV